MSQPPLTRREQLRLWQQKKKSQSLSGPSLPPPSIHVGNINVLHSESTSQNFQVGGSSSSTVRTPVGNIGSTLSTTNVENQQPQDLNSNNTLRSSLDSLQSMQSEMKNGPVSGPGSGYSIKSSRKSAPKNNVNPGNSYNTNSSGPGSYNNSPNDYSQNLNLSAGLGPGPGGVADLTNIKPPLNANHYQKEKQQIQTQMNQVPGTSQIRRNSSTKQGSESTINNVKYENLSQIQNSKISSSSSQNRNITVVEYNTRSRTREELRENGYLKVYSQSSQSQSSNTESQKSQGSKKSPVEDDCASAGGCGQGLIAIPDLTQKNDKSISQTKTQSFNPESRSSISTKVTKNSASNIPNQSASVINNTNIIGVAPEEKVNQAPSSQSISISSHSHNKSISKQILNGPVDFHVSELALSNEILNEIQWHNDRNSGSRAPCSTPQPEYRRKCRRHDWTQTCLHAVVDELNVLLSISRDHWHNDMNQEKDNQIARRTVHADRSYSSGSNTKVMQQTQSSSLRAPQKYHSTQISNQPAKLRQQLHQQTQHSTHNKSSLSNNNENKNAVPTGGSSSTSDHPSSKISSNFYRGSQNSSNFNKNSVRSDSIIKPASGPGDPDSGQTAVSQTQSQSVISKACVSRISRIFNNYSSNSNTNNESDNQTQPVFGQNNNQKHYQAYDNDEIQNYNETQHNVQSNTSAKSSPVNRTSILKKSGNGQSQNQTGTVPTQNDLHRPTMLSNIISGSNNNIHSVKQQNQIQLIERPRSSSQRYDPVRGQKRRSARRSLSQESHTNNFQTEDDPYQCYDHGTGEERQDNDYDHSNSQSQISESVCGGKSATSGIMGDINVGVNGGGSALFPEKKMIPAKVKQGDKSMKNNFDAAEAANSNDTITNQFKGSSHRSIRGALRSMSMVPNSAANDSSEKTVTTRSVGGPGPFKSRIMANQTHSGGPLIANNKPEILNQNNNNIHQKQTHCQDGPVSMTGETVTKSTDFVYNSNEKSSSSCYAAQYVDYGLEPSPVVTKNKDLPLISPIANPRLQVNMSFDDIMQPAELDYEQQYDQKNQQLFDNSKHVQSQSSMCQDGDIQIQLSSESVTVPDSDAILNQNITSHPRSNVVKKNQTTPGPGTVHSNFQQTLDTAETANSGNNYDSCNATAIEPISSIKGHTAGNNSNCNSFYRTPFANDGRSVLEDSCRPSGDRRGGITLIQSDINNSQSKNCYSNGTRLNHRADSTKATTTSLGNYTNTRTGPVQENHRGNSFVNSDQDLGHQNLNPNISPESHSKYKSEPPTSVPGSGIFGGIHENSVITNKIQNHKQGQIQQFPQNNNPNSNLNGQQNQIIQNQMNASSSIATLHPQDCSSLEPNELLFGPDSSFHRSTVVTESSRRIQRTPNSAGKSPFMKAEDHFPGRRSSSPQKPQFFSAEKGPGCGDSFSPVNRLSMISPAKNTVIVQNNNQQSQNLNDTLTNNSNSAAASNHNLNVSNVELSLEHLAPHLGQTDNCGPNNVNVISSSSLTLSPTSAANSVGLNNGVGQYHNNHINNSHTMASVYNSESCQNFESQYQIMSNNDNNFDQSCHYIDRNLNQSGPNTNYHPDVIADVEHWKSTIIEHPGHPIDENWINQEKLVDNEQILCQCYDIDVFYFFDQRDIWFKMFEIHPYQLSSIPENEELW